MGRKKQGEEKEYRCNCAEHCKLPGGKKVKKSTYYAHAIFRKSLSPVPGGFRTPDLNSLPGIGEGVMPGQAPPIADILEGYPRVLPFGHDGGLEDDCDPSFRG